jgi:hypothetical protein
MQIFLFGAGYSARAFAAANPDPATVVVGTTRSEAKFATLRAADIEPLLYNGASAPEPALSEVLSETTHLVISVAPDEKGDPVLRTFADTIVRNMPKLRWIGYLSTVGVYGDHQGQWIDEESECRPVSGRSTARLKAEQAWTALAHEAKIPLAILRLSGIYGPGRNAFVNLESGTAKRLIKPDQVFNRIYVSDIAGALWHLIDRNLGGVFNVTDDLPAPPQDVVTDAARIMGIAPPAEQPFASADLTPMQRSFYGENKRVSNAKLRATGYSFICPDYHAALARLWAGDWRGERSRDARSPMKS